MDLQTITDIKELKALAYDALAVREQADRDLQMINNRIAQLSEAQQSAETAKPART